MEKAFDPNHIRRLRVHNGVPAETIVREHGGIALTNVGYEFLRYYMWACGDQGIAHEKDIRPPDFVPVLPFVRYFEWDGRGLHCRVFGSALATAVGIDLTGYDMLALQADDLKPRTIKVVEDVHRYSCGAVSLWQMTGAGGGNVDVEFTYFPVAVDPGRPVRVIGTMMIAGDLDAFIASADENGFFDGLAFVGMKIVEDRFIDVGFGTPAS
jgi:hypothetical protein